MGIAVHLASRASSQANAVAAHIVDDVHALDGHIAEDGARTGITDTPAEGSLVGDEVRGGRDGQSSAPTGYECRDGGEALDLARRHGVAVAIEDGHARDGVADTREGHSRAHGLNLGHQSVVRILRQQQEGGAAVNDGICSRDPRK